VNIENVQRRATKMVTGLKDKSYQERLLILGLPTLVYRRERTDMLQIFKILHKYESVNFENIEIAPNSNRGHKYKLRKQHVKTGFGVNRFTNRIVNNWNALSSDTAESDSINTFKSSLNDYRKNKDSKFTYQH